MLRQGGFRSRQRSALRSFCEFNRSWSPGAGAEQERTEDTSEVRPGRNIHSKFRGCHRRNRSSRHRRPHASWKICCARPLQGKVYAVNPKHEEVLGLKAYKSIRDIPKPVDLAVIVTPAATVPQIIGECVDAGAKSAVVISAGFKERGAEGAALEQQIQEQLRRGSMRLDWPQLPGHHEPGDRVECHIRQRCAACRQCRILESERRTVDRHPRLEPSRRSQLQRDRFHRLHARRWLGRFDLSLRRRSPHQEHPALHGIGGRCAVVLVRRPRSRAHQADHRDQVRPLGSRLHAPRPRILGR